MNGKGTLISPNGDKYEGEFKDHVLTGRGIFTAVSGYIYMGDFKNGQYNGNGKKSGQYK